MRRDPKEFRERFLRWKAGELVYKDGLPAYLDGKGSGKINWSRWDDAELTSYTVPFINEKRITLTNAGRATGAVLSTNLLDSIADNADRAGLPLLDALGLAVKESTLGNPTDDRTAWKLSSGIRQAFNNEYPGTELHINYWGDALNERDDVINYHKGHQSDDPNSKGKSVLQEAFEFYRLHPDKYNPGQPGYLTAVNKRGEEVIQSPEVKRWKTARDVRKKLEKSMWNGLNPLLKPSKFNLPKFADGKEYNYFRPNGNQIKIDENTGELIDLVNGERGTLQLPEVTVTAAHPNSYRSSYDPNVIRNFTDWLPVVGDIGTGIDIKNAIQNLNYAEAGLLGGMMLLPAPLAKGANRTIKPLLSKLRNSSDLVDYTYKGFNLSTTADAFKKIQLFVAQNELAGRNTALFGDGLVKKGKEYFEYPSVVIENLKNSIYPRMKAMRPWVKDSDFDKKFYATADGKWTMHPAETFKLAHGENSMAVGEYFPGTDNIALRAGTDVESVLLHEIRHKLDNHMPLTQQEEEYLRAAYGDLFLSSNSHKDYDMFLEAVTTNRDARDILLGPVHSRKTPVNLLNKIIDMASDQLILEAISESNGYGQNFVDALIGDGPLDASLVPKEQIKAWRNAMKYVGSAALTFGLSKPFLTNTQNELRNK